MPGAATAPDLRGSVQDWIDHECFASQLRLDELPGGHRLWLQLQTRLFHLFVPDAPSRVQTVSLYFAEFSSRPAVQITVSIPRCSYRSLRGHLETASGSGAIALDAHLLELLGRVLAPVQELCRLDLFGST